MTTRHYLPVYRTIDRGPTKGETQYVIVEAHVDESGLLTGWTDFNNPVSLMGESRDDLIGTCERMLNDTRRWEPARLEDLKSGYKPIPRKTP